MRKQTRLSLTALLGSLLCLAASCTSVRVDNQWQDQEFKGRVYLSILLVSEAPSLGERRTFEDLFAQTMQVFGVYAKASYGLLADDKVDDPAERFQAARKGGMEAVLVTRYLDAVTEESYVPPTSTPIYSYDERRKESYVSGYSYTPGYNVTRTYQRLEVNLYDVNTGKLVWTAVTSFQPTTDLNALAQSVAKTVGEKLKEAGLIA